MSRHFLLFENTRAVIKAESQMKEAKICYRIMPVPREISSQCGMCLELIGHSSARVPDCLTVPSRLVTVNA